MDHGTHGRRSWHTTARAARLPAVIELTAADAEADISPTDGGRVARLAIAGRDLLVIGSAGDDPMSWGSYPMAPFAGRLREGTFEAGGRTYQLPINLAPHAIHGTAFTSRWDVLDAGLDHVELDVALAWPLGGRAHQHVQLLPDALVCILTVVAGDLAMPVTLGWHPWFVKPDDDRLRFDSMYERGPDHLPTGARVPPAPRPWDDCLTGPLAPLELSYRASGGRPALTVTVESDCDHWVVYDQPAHATCVEPQSGPPDAVHLGAATWLEPDAMLQRTMTIRWALG